MPRKLSPGSPSGKSTPSTPLTSSPSSHSNPSISSLSLLIHDRSRPQSLATTPTLKMTPAFPSTIPPTTSTLHARGHSFSAPFRHRPASPSHSSDGGPITRVISNPLPSVSSLSPIVSGRPGGSIFRSRSPSPARGAVAVTKESEEGDVLPTSTWWKRKVHPPRPWAETPKHKHSILPEQTEGYVHTRERVVRATASILGTAANITHEALYIGVDLLEFAPVIGLQTAARTLLEIWDAVKLIEINRLACLRLTERCADSLISVREEIHEAGNEVSEELQRPIERLHEAFIEVHTFLQKQAHRPFLQRYLKRHEILRSIAACDDLLRHALSMFSIRIQIRTVRMVQENEMRRRAEATALLDSLGLPLKSPHAPPGLPPLDALPSDSAELHATLRALHERQNTEDAARDVMDLRELMRAALQTNSDADMIDILQIARDEMPEAIKTLQRALEVEVEREWSADAERPSPVLQRSPTVLPGRRSRTATISTILEVREGSEVSGGSDTSVKRREGDTLDREFMESGIDALRRLSEGVELASLPSWTITRYEVDLEEKVGLGFFSDVYRGVWREHIVAIKVLAEMTPRRLFVHEISIWKGLSHPNVLELLGASSASGDPPWFLVSPYYSNGSLVQYLKGLESMLHVDLLKMIHEVSKGMAYLHQQGVLHGDLKAANVLVDDRHRCVISDFGQSEMKSEVYRISRTPLPRGTLRWQAPELMLGADTLSQEMDIYAFAICCVEILTKGMLPWPLQDDEAVRHLVLVNDQRPSLPLTQGTNSGLAEVIQACWVRQPHLRPSFAEVARRIERLRTESGQSSIEPPRPMSLLDQWAAQEHHHTRPSPDMRPIALPGSGVKDDLVVISQGSSSDANLSVAIDKPFSAPAVSKAPFTSPIAGPHGPDFPEGRASLFYPGSDASSVDTLTFDDSLSESGLLASRTGGTSLPPVDSAVMDVWNERRYRMLLQHDYHTSLTLPLWSPAPVAVGAVGFLEKPEGRFKTLFNCYEPSQTSDGLASELPSLDGYGKGKVTLETQRQDKRNAALRGLDLIHGFIFKNRGEGLSTQSISRTQPFQLRAGHKVAYLYAETTLYRYMEDLQIPKKWFQHNIDHIVKLYGQKYQVTKEDLFLVIGTLEAQDHALFVSHNHPDGQVNFNVFTAAKQGQPWGAFSMSVGDVSTSITGGPIYHEEMSGSSVSASKVSTAKSSGPWDAVLLARLRFKPDAAEPTSL